MLVSDDIYYISLRNYMNGNCMMNCKGKCNYMHWFYYDFFQLHQIFFISILEVCILNILFKIIKTLISW